MKSKSLIKNSNESSSYSEVSNNGDDPGEVSNNGDDPAFTNIYPKFKPVQMRFPKVTLQQIDSLKKNTNTENRTKIVCSSIHLADFIVQTIKTGGKAYIENRNGEREELHIRPLKNNFYF